FIITPSQHLMKKLLSYGLTTRNEALPNMLDTSFWSLPHELEHPEILPPFDGFRIAAVGRVSLEKRQAELIRAVAQIKDQVKIQLIVIGDGPALSACKQLASELDVGGNVLFVGRQTPPNVAAILQRTNAFTLASYKFDSQGIVILEAI